jgi:hypothetical protein
MMQRGLWEEARDFILAHGMSEAPRSPDQGGASVPGSDVVLPHRGLFQAIGYREFFPMFEHGVPGEVARDDPMLRACVERLKMHHVRYAKQQLKWISARVLPRNAPVHALDTTHLCPAGRFDSQRWEADILRPALELCRFYSDRADLEGDPVGLPRANSVAGKRTTPLLRFDCKICGITVIGLDQWRMHCGSRGHRKNASGAKHVSRLDQRLQSLFPTADRGSSPGP